MKKGQSPVLSPRSNQYSNPNDDHSRNPNQPLYFIEKPVYIKKTFSEINSKHSNRSSVNSQNQYNRSTKIPKVILEEIAIKTRQQNQIRYRDSIELSKKKHHLSKRKSSQSNKNKPQDLFDHEDQVQSQKIQPTGSIRKSLTANKFSKINSMLSSRTTTCPICMVQGNNKEFISIDDNACTHVYCRSCIHQYVIFKIKMFEKVTCPDQGCNATMKMTSSLYAQLPLDTRKNFKKIIQYNEVLETKTKRICPNEHCQGVLDISNPSANPRCPQCLIVYCRKCYFRNHAGQCTTHQLQFFSQTLNYRQCARCQNMIQKNDGCNHMTCRCGYQFCYLCGEKWRNTHNCEGLGDEPWVRDTWECCCCECRECDFCDNIDYCCECICFDEWECCELRPIRYLAKFLIILGIMGLGMPLWITYMVVSTIIRFVLGILTGLIIIPCSAIFSEYDNGAWIVMALIFFPITIPALIVYGIKMVFEEQADDIRDEFCLPCQVVNEIIQL